MSAADEDWHAWRAEGWGASDIAAAWTGRYGAAYRVVAHKSGRLPDGGNGGDVDRMARGTALEPTLAAMVQLATGWWVVGEQTWCEHPDEPTHRATVDGFVVADPADDLRDAIGPVEFKTHGVEVRPAWDYYEAQVQWQMHVTGFARAVLAVATVDDTTAQVVGFRLSIIDADPLLQASLVALADELTAHLEAGTLPDPDGSDLATAAVRAMTYTTDPDDALAVDLTELEDRVARYVEVKAAVKSARAEQTELENVLRDRVGLAAHGVAGPWVVTYSKPRRVLNEERLLEDYPDLGHVVLDRTAAEDHLTVATLDEYREPIGARVLTVRQVKGEP